MKNFVICKFQTVHNWRLWAAISVIAVIMAELIVSAMSLLLKGEIAPDYLLTGLIASIIVAPLCAATLSYLLSEISNSRYRQSESREHASQTSLSIAIHNAQMLIWELDFATGELRYDDAHLALLDIMTEAAPHDVGGWLSIIHPDDRATFMTHFQAALPVDAQIFDLEYRCIQRTDTWGWVHTKGRVIRHDAEGNPLLAVGSTINITERKRAELKFRDAQNRFELIFNSNPDVMVISRLPEGKVTNVNEAFVKNTGYAREEAIGKTTVELAFWSDADRHRMTDAIKKDGYCKGLEFDFLIKDGQKRTGSFSAVVTSLQGVPHLVSTIHDISARKQNEEALRASENRANTLAGMLRLLCDNVPDMIWAKDMNLNYIFANKAVCAQLLSASDTNEPLGRNDQFFALRERNRHPDDPDWHTFGELCQNSDNITLDSGQSCQFDEYGNVQGSFMFLDVHKSPFVDEEGVVIGVVGSARNVTEQKKAEEKLRLASLILENSSEAMFVTDTSNRILDINPAFTRLTGYELEEVIGHDAAFLHSEHHDADFYRKKWHEINLNGHWQGEIWNRRKNGEIYVEWLTISTIYDEDGLAHRHVALFSDITEKKKAEELIWTQANFDYLTHLPNRRMFLDRLTQDIKKAHRAGLKLALLFLDLDHFKEVNDTLGHDLGDALLIEVAQRISACVRDSDTVARLGGDEFTITLTELTKLEEIDAIERIADNIIQTLSNPFHVDGNSVYISVSIGITLYPEDGTELKTLLKNADQAMFVSKQAGRNRYSYFTRTMQDAAQHRLHLTNDLRVALAEGQFQLYYQPIIELNTGRIVKAEALLRWHHPTRGFVSPAEFIPLAEDSGLIHELGDWVFAESAKQALICKSLSGADFQISVNVSPVQIHGTSSHSQWLEQLKAMGLSGQSIVIEITEGLLLDSSGNVTTQLLAFRDAGIQVAIDDFGTGYSALSYLKKLDIDYLKIDQSFICNLAPDSSDMALCEAITVMAHKLGLKVIAEGVETAQQNALLTAIGCDYAQGYLHSRPLPADQLEAWLKQCGETT